MTKSLQSIRPKKVLILGTSGFHTETEAYVVHSLPWTALENSSVPSDYDVLILDLLVNRPTKANSSIDRVLTTTQAEAILYHGGKIIVLGDPRVPITGAYGHQKNILDWIGISLFWTPGPGDVVQLADDDVSRDFHPYLRHVEKWDYSLKAAMLTQSLAKTFNIGTARVDNGSVLTHNLATTRFGQAVASMHWIVRSTATADKPQSQYGPIVLLPKSSLSHIEAVRLVLTSLVGVELETQPPTWVQNVIPTVAQASNDQKITETKEALRDITNQLVRLQEESKDARKHLRLLYEVGDALEQAVWDALETLGATLTKPTTPGKEDGWISVEVYGKRLEGVLEIKSTRNDSFPESGLRQLLDWVNRGIVEHQKRYKPIFIGNSAIERSPQDRPNPFSDSWRRSADLASASGLLTEDLYRAILLDERRELDRDKFWNAIFTGRGIANLNFVHEAVSVLPDI